LDGWIHRFPPHPVDVLRRMRGRRPHDPPLVSPTVGSTRRP
jgi:hypothetical protein